MPTVRQLIEKLQQFDPDLRVVTPGFDESGYSDITEPEEIELALNVDTGGHWGEHKKFSEVYKNERFFPKPYECCRAVVIDFGSDWAS